MSSYALEGSAAHALAYRCLTNEEDAHAYLGWGAVPVASDDEGHAPIGPSSMSRRFNCVGSFQAEAATPAEEDDSVDFSLVMEPAPHYPHGDPVPVTQDMVDAVQVYLDHVRHWQKQLGPDATCYLEERTRPERNPIDPDCWGTPDCVLVSADGTLVVVIDYKHGAGVGVEATDNLQLISYAILAVAKYNLNPTGVSMEIVQPRARDGLPAVRGGAPTMLTSALLKWAEKLSAAMKAAKEPGAPRTAGDHCRWCRAKAYQGGNGAFVTCPAVESKAIEVAQADFGKPVATPPPVPDEPERLAFILANEEMVKDFLESCRERATEMAKNGQRVPGNKLVRKGTKRAYLDKGEALEAFAKRFGKGNVSEPKLMNMGDLEKWIKREFSGRKLKNALALFNEHVGKPLGELVLAPLDDKREEHRADAVSDFGGDRLAGLLG